MLWLFTFLIFSATALNSCSQSPKPGPGTKAELVGADKLSSPMRIQVGVPGDRPTPHLVNMVSPVYPEEAATKKVEGVVRLHVVVGRNGEVEQTYLLGGDPLLTRAAIEAVKQWRYKL